MYSRKEEAARERTIDHRGPSVYIYASDTNVCLRVCVCIDGRRDGFINIRGTPPMPGEIGYVRIAR